MCRCCYQLKELVNLIGQLVKNINDICSRVSGRGMRGSNSDRLQLHMSIQAASRDGGNMVKLSNAHSPKSRSQAHVHTPFFLPWAWDITRPTLPKHIGMAP